MNIGTMDSDHSTSPPKKLKSPLPDGSMNPKTSVICGKVPDSLFETGAAEKHFNKFGKVQRIKLYRKRHMCLVEFDQPKAAELAVLNAGAYDGFMFDVTRRFRVRRKSKREDDPDWVPDPEVEEELSAMSGAPSYRFTRQKSMDIDPMVKKRKPPVRVTKVSPVKKRVDGPFRTKPILAQPMSSVVPAVIEAAPVIVVSNTHLSTSEAAAELHQLSFKVSLTPDEQWRILDARDKILRAWGGAGSRVKVGGATIGTCPDMCPEKELLHRQFEHQVMTLETAVDSDGELEPWRAVKQYSRSSADQEIPMCYELRPAPVLMRTCAYLLHEIADTKRQVTLADWFHFMWDRFRSIRKDITQQALCCGESIQLVEMCARFHAHSAARLADLEHTQFDQKLNTDNLTKCLQTLKHMYDDNEVTSEQKPNEAEFRGYIALLNLGDSNFLWEIKYLPHEIQKSEPIVFAVQVFIALDNNNYVKFFRLIKHRATYLQACILLRYFNDVRARALARIVKGFAPRGSSRYPAEELMKTLSFESVESMKSFVNHYGLRLARTTDTDKYDVILNRNQFIEDSDPYPIARAIHLIESKRQSNVGEVIAGGRLPNYDFANCGLHSSFNNDGKLKTSALIAEDLGYNTINDSNKDVQSLKAEVLKLLNGSKSFVNIDKPQEMKRNIFIKSEQPSNYSFANEEIKYKGFSFQPAIPIAPKESIHTSPDKMIGTDPKKIFTFSKPKESPEKDNDNIFKSLSKSASDKKFIFATVSNEHVDPFKAPNNLFKLPKTANDVFNKPTFGNSIFSQKTDNNLDSTQVADTKNIFSSGSTNLFTKKEDVPKSHNIFKPIIQTDKNIFGKSTTSQENDIKTSSNIFGSIGKASFSEKPSLFKSSNVMQHGVVSNGESVFAKTSPGNLFKNALQPNDSETKNYSIFQSKNKPTVANSIFNSVSNRNMNDIYEFDQNVDETNNNMKMHEMYEQQIKEDAQREMAEKLRKEEERRQEEERQKEEMRRREEEKRKEEERRREEEKRKEEQRQREEERRREEERLKKIEEKNQQELKERLEKERQAKLKRKAEEEERKFKERVETESEELLNEIINTIEEETSKEVLKEEMDSFRELMLHANETTENIFSEVCDEICHLEIKAEMFLSKRLMTKWFSIWKKQVARNLKRRKLLEDTPVWLTDNAPYEEANNLRRLVEHAALKNMNAIHRGYRFNGELRHLPSPEPYNLMEIIRSPLLKRARQINYPYDKCFFWKVTLISPGSNKWLCRKVNLEKWLKDAFGDKKSYEISSCLINVGRHSWNNLMNFAISVSLLNKEQKSEYSEALEGANSLLLYVTEHNITDIIDEIMKQKYSYQVIPVAIITSLVPNDLGALEMQLIKIKNNHLISDYKLYFIDSNNVFTSLDTNTKRAIKWLAKNYQKSPPIEIDYLKSICERYLCNEIWTKLKFERDIQMNVIDKDLNNLIDIYNISLEKLTQIITNEDLFNYPSFPLEFKEYLDSSSPYPKPYEFIPSSVQNMENVDAIKDIMNRLKLPRSTLDFHPHAAGTVEHVRKYCRQIGWFENPEQVVCKVVALLPDGYSVMPCQDLTNLYEHYDLIDLLNIIVYEKISKLRNFENRYAIYEKSALEDYRNSPWIYETNVLSSLKHKAVDYEDELDHYIDAKRRKMAIDSQECLILDDNDETLLQENIQVADESISNFSNYKEAVQQLEQQLEVEMKKSDELDNLLKSALCDAV